MKKILFLISFIASLTGHAQLLDSISLAALAPYTDLQEALKEPEKVVKLELRKLKLNTFPLEILQFTNLQYLDLSKNKISELPADISKLEKLQVLILSRNNLEVLPFDIGKLNNLRELNVNQNELISLPTSIGNLQNLLYLDLWSNNLTNFPDELKKLDKLKVLDLRAILLNDPDQLRIKELLPNATVYMSPSCKCQY